MTRFSSYAPVHVPRRLEMLYNFGWERLTSEYTSKWDLSFVKIGKTTKKGAEVEFNGKISDQLNFEYAASIGNYRFESFKFIEGRDTSNRNTDFMNLD